MSSIITVLCPSTGREIHSGILADGDTFSSLPVEVQVTCPACGAVHTWFTPSARTQEHKWKAAYWAAQAALMEWPHTRELWRTMQQSYLRLAELEQRLEQKPARKTCSDSDLARSSVPPGKQSAVLQPSS